MSLKHEKTKQALHLLWYLYDVLVNLYVICIFYVYYGVLKYIRAYLKVVNKEIFKSKF
jgi:hypothetical protein